MPKSPAIVTSLTARVLVPALKLVTGICIAATSSEGMAAPVRLASRRLAERVPVTELAHRFSGKELIFYGTAPLLGLATAIVVIMSARFLVNLVRREEMGLAMRVEGRDF